jgi:hypothetical protein
MTEHGDRMNDLIRSGFGRTTIASAPSTPSAIDTLIRQRVHKAPPADDTTATGAPPAPVSFDGGARTSAPPASPPTPGAMMRAEYEQRREDVVDRARQIDDLGSRS